MSIKVGLLTSLRLSETTDDAIKMFLYVWFLNDLRQYGGDKWHFEWQDETINATVTWELKDPFYDESIWGYHQVRRNDLLFLITVTKSLYSNCHYRNLMNEDLESYDSNTRKQFHQSTP